MYVYRCISVYMYMCVCLLYICICMYINTYIHSYISYYTYPYVLYYTYMYMYVYIFKIQDINFMNIPKPSEHREYFWIFRLESLFFSVSFSLSKTSQHILKPSPRFKCFHLVKLFQFLLSLISALFIRSFFNFLLSRG